MKQKLKKLLYIIPIIILILLIIWLIYLYNNYKVAKLTKEVVVNFDEKQKICKLVGHTSNYIYLSRYDQNNNAIRGAKWEVTNMNGNSVGTFETNSDGNGGIVGLDYGEYYLQEKEVPEGYKIKNYKYKIIISASDTSYSFVEKDE